MNTISKENAAKTKTAKGLLAVICAVAILLTGFAGVMVWKQSPVQRALNTLIIQPEVQIVGPGAIQKTIRNKAAAKQVALDTFSKQGVPVGEETLAESEDRQVGDNTYYRFAQTYQGVPVYGRTMTVAVNDKGKVQMLSGNYLSDLTDVELQPKKSEKDILTILKKKYGENCTFGTPHLTIYTFADKKELVYHVPVNGIDLAENCFVSAKTGEIVRRVNTVYTEQAMGMGTRDLDGNEGLTFPTELKDDLYYLIDSKKNIGVMDANGGWLVVEEGTVNGINAFRTTTKGPLTKVTRVTNKGELWDNPMAVTAMTRVQLAFDFWDTLYGRKGFSGNCGTTAVVINVGGDPTNSAAYYFSDEKVALTVLAFGQKSPVSYNTVGHEYMHALEGYEVGMTYQGETGAIMEAYSDIFGELLEDWATEWKDGKLRPAKDKKMDNGCNWIYQSSTSRSMRNPHDSKKPITYQGKYWAKTEEGAADEGGVHTNHTVITHAAYLMSTGTVGKTTYEALSTKQIADLFYYTLPSLPKDCSFSVLKKMLIVYGTAMKMAGWINQTQLRCIYAALDATGIPDIENGAAIKEQYGTETAQTTTTTEAVTTTTTNATTTTTTEVTTTTTTTTTKKVTTTNSAATRLEEFIKPYKNKTKTELLKKYPEAERLLNTRGLTYYTVDFDRFLCLGFDSNGICKGLYVDLDMVYSNLSAQMSQREMEAIVGQKLTEKMVEESWWAMTMTEKGITLWIEHQFNTTNGITFDRNTQCLITW